jgi:glycosyltransferase involved in cell wall biosynthesis
VTRVLLVHQPVDGGVGRHVSDLLAGLTADGLEVRTCGPGPPAPNADAAHHIRLDLQRAISARADAASLAAFSRIISEYRPDVIHAHSSKAGAVARLARLRRPRVPVVYTPHGYAFAGFFSSPHERQVYRQVERALSPLASRVVCVCEAEARLARSVGPARRVEVVHNGISLPDSVHDDQRMTTLAREGPVICALTQLRPGKGLETLIDAMPGVLARHPSARLAIWGEGPEAGELERRMNERGVGAAVRFLGATTNPLGVLAPATVFVLPSWAESFPYVMLEAMSVGVATVASDVGGIAEAIRPGHDGLLVPPRDPDALADSLSLVLENGVHRAAMADSALDRVRREFSTRRLFDGIRRVYDDVLERA